MGFFDQIKDITKAAADKTGAIAKNVGEKAEAALEIQKLSSAISKQQDFISKEYKAIGEYVYSKCKEEGEIPEELQEHLNAISSAYSDIELLNKKIAQIKVDKFSGDIPRISCPECGKAVVATSKFCPECGAKISEDEPEAAEPAAEEAPAEAAPSEEVQDAEVVKEENKSEYK